MAQTTQKTRIVIMGATGRDFHNFNTVYRDNPNFEVIAFTGTQIPNFRGQALHLTYKLFLFLPASKHKVNSPSEMSNVRLDPVKFRGDLKNGGMLGYVFSLF